MGLYDDTVGVPRRTMVLFFLVDVSGSMTGSKIGTVNSAIEEVVPEIRSISAENADARIQVATLAFSTGARWIENAPVDAENFNWTYLDANGVTDLGEACIQLNSKLSKSEFMSTATGSFAPVIFLLSDGSPTDDYKRGLEKLKQNSWFKKAIKVAIAIGEDANDSVLADFTGNVEAVIKVHTPEALKKWIQFVSVRSSEIGSKSASTGFDYETNGTPEPSDIDYKTKSEEFIEELNKEKEDPTNNWDDFTDDGIVW